MTENEVLFQISNIVNGHLSYPQAAQQVALLLERYGSLDSFDQPDRSPYTVQRLADFADRQLGMLLTRTRLAERRAQLRAEIEKIEEDLATRKLMQRAEGILVARR